MRIRCTLFQSARNESRLSGISLRSAWSPAQIALNLTGFCAQYAGADSICRVFDAPAAELSPEPEEVFLCLRSRRFHRRLPWPGLVFRRPMCRQPSGKQRRRRCRSPPARPLNRRRPLERARWPPMRRAPWRGPLRRKLPRERPAPRARPLLCDIRVKVVLPRCRGRRRWGLRPWSGQGGRI